MPGPDPGWAGRLWLVPDHGMVLYAGTGGTAATHRHHALQLVVALDGQVQVVVGGEERTRRSTIIPRDTEHALQVTGQSLFLWVDPHSATGRVLDALAVERGGEELDLDVPRPLAVDDAAGAAGVAAALVAQLGRPARRTPEPSAHVSGTLAYLDRVIGDTPTPTLTAAASHVGVSPSRLTHLFSREVGIPFRRYVLWLRLRRAVDLVASGNDLTRAAAEAGFSDSAHLSRTFRTMFGLPPSALLVMRVATLDERGGGQW